jgi:hypothetical protein
MKQEPTLQTEDMAIRKKRWAALCFFINVAYTSSIVSCILQSMAIAY